jgi:hypothetical protein
MISMREQTNLSLQENIKNRGVKAADKHPKVKSFTQFVEHAILEKIERDDLDVTIDNEDDGGE